VLLISFPGPGPKTYRLRDKGRKIKAELKNGVLTVIVGKRPEAQHQVKRITINA